MEIIDNGVRIYYISLAYLFAAKGEKLSRQTRGTLVRFLDLTQRFIEFMIGFNREKRKLRIPDDDGQHIIEIMGNPSGEASNRVKFLGL